MIDFVSRLFRQPEYIHVLINPLPIYGLALSLLGLVLALLLRSRRAQIAALALVLVSAASAWPAAEYGEQAYDRVLSMTDGDGQAWLDEHARRANELVLFFYVLAAVSLLAIILPIKWSKSGPMLASITLLLGVAVLVMGGYIAYAGGRIRHREFRVGPPPPKHETHT